MDAFNIFLCLVLLIFHCQDKFVLFPLLSSGNSVVNAVSNQNSAINLKAYSAVFFPLKGYLGSHKNLSCIH